MSDAPETLKAYWAGLFDGEGSIVIQYPNGTTPRLRLQIVNNDIPPLEMLKTLYGGGIWKSGPTSKCWATERNNEQLEFLKDITPYLIIRRKEAEIALAFVLLDVGKGGKGTPDQQKAREDRIKLSIVLSRLAEARKAAW